MMKEQSGVIPEKDCTVLVYCRSGNRSKTAPASLVKLGYSQVNESVGNITWPYAIVSLKVKKPLQLPVDRLKAADWWRKPAFFDMVSARGNPNTTMR